MKRVCVIGNSHLGMIAAAYREAAPKGCAFTFWGCPELKALDFECAGPALRAVSPGLKTCLSEMGSPDVLDLDAFDAAAIVAMSLSAFSVAGLLRDHDVIEAVPVPEFSAQEATCQSERQALSEAALKAALVDKAQTSLGFQILSHVRSVSNLPIFLVAQPFPSVAVLRSDGKFPVLRRLIGQHQGDFVARALQGALQSSFDAFDNLTLLHQPQRTVTKGCLTKRAYARHAPRFQPDKCQPRRDILHANAGVGHAILRRIRGRLLA